MEVGLYIVSTSKKEIFMPDLDLDLDYLPRMPERKGFGIGCIGAGFIMRDCHLVAYRNAGFNPVAIASRSRARAEETARLRGVPKVYDTCQLKM